jgi:crotonobetainyl-CoA:carnitine CoA-transferase CaiB-like acyl-CoA transferase
VVAEEQFWQNGYLQDVAHPHFPGHRVVGIPVVMSETAPRVQGVAPELGQHTELVLLDLGYSWDDIERLRAQGVIATLPATTHETRH